MLSIRPITRGAILLVALALALVGASMLASSGRAAEPAPNLALHVFSTPSSFSTTQNKACMDPTGFFTSVCAVYQVTAVNTGSVATNGSTIVLSDALPPGVEAVAPQAELRLVGAHPAPLSRDCTIEAAVLVKCRFPVQVRPDEMLELLIIVTVKEGALDGGVNVAKVSGGGVPAREEGTALSLDEQPQFGLSAFPVSLNALDGSPDGTGGG